MQPTDLAPPGSARADVPWPWWEQPPLLQRYLRDLVLGELAALRPGRPVPRDWPPDQPLLDGLGLDSLEHLALSTTLAEVAPPPDAATAQALDHAQTLAEWLPLVARGLAHSGAHQVFRSSGSTGVPKRCGHPLALLWQEMQAMAQVIGPRRRVVTLVRSHHIYGFLFGLLLPRALGDLPVLDLAGASPASLPAQLQPGDLVVAYPEAWGALARLLPAWPADVVGCTSTGPCPDATATALLEAGLSRLLQIYGSSETAGVGWRDQPGAPYRLHDFWRRDAGDPQRLCRPWPGEGAEQPMLAVALQDTLHWDDPRHFRPGPRLDGSVQIGGVNVQPEAVARVLRRHPAVAEVAVRPFVSTLGLRFKALVVPRQGTPHEGLADALLDWSRQHLAPAARPVQLQLGAALPRNEMGKASDWPDPHP